MFAAAAKLLQSCPTLCDPIDGSPPGSSVPGILQARTLEWFAISFSSACMHAKSFQSCPTLWPHRRQPTRLLCPWDSPGKNTGVGCHFLLQWYMYKYIIYILYASMYLTELFWGLNNYYNSWYVIGLYWWINVSQYARDVLRTWYRFWNRFKTVASCICLQD